MIDSTNLKNKWKKFSVQNVLAETGEDFLEVVFFDEVQQVPHQLDEILEAWGVTVLEIYQDLTGVEFANLMWGLAMSAQAYEALEA